MCGEQRHEQPEASTQKRNIGVPFFRGRTSSLRGRPPLRGSFVDSKGGPLLNGAGSNPRERDVAAVQADREHTTETRDRLPHWQEEATHQPRGTPHHHHMPPQMLTGQWSSAARTSGATRRQAGFSPCSWPAERDEGTRQHACSPYNMARCPTVARRAALSSLRRRRVNERGPRGPFHRRGSGGRPMLASSSRAHPAKDAFPFVPLRSGTRAPRGRRARSLDLPACAPTTTHRGPQHTTRTGGKGGEC